MEIKHSKFSFPIKFYMTDEERMWLERIAKHSLWYRYAPEHIKQCDVLDYYLLDINYTNLFSKKPPYKDKRTRNEIGQEKHEARKWSECGK